MRKITFRNSRKLSLVGNLYSAKSRAVIIMAHGFISDKSSQGRFDRIANALNSLDLNVLAFDFSGCGDSDPDVLSVENQMDDLNSAISLIKSQGYDKIALFGYSLGSLICLKCFRDDIETMVLMGALTHSMTYDWDDEFTQEQLTELDNTGIMNIKTEFGNYQIGHQMLRDFEEIEQEKMLKSVTCPILIIHGDNEEDIEEVQLLSNSQKGMPLLSETSELVLIKGAKHDFSEQIDQVIDLSSKWYMEHLFGY